MDRSFLPISVVSFCYIHMFGLLHLPFLEAPPLSLSASLSSSPSLSSSGISSQLGEVLLVHNKFRQEYLPSYFLKVLIPSQPTTTDYSSYIMSENFLEFLSRSLFAWRTFFASSKSSGLLSGF